MSYAIDEQITDCVIPAIQSFYAGAFTEERFKIMISQFFGSRKDDELRKIMLEAMFDVQRPGEAVKSVLCLYNASASRVSYFIDDTLISEQFGADR